MQETQQLIQAFTQGAEEWKIHYPEAVKALKALEVQVNIRPHDNSSNTLFDSLTEISKASQANPSGFTSQQFNQWLHQYPEAAKSLQSITASTLGQGVPHHPVLESLKADLGNEHPKLQAGINKMEGLLDKLHGKHDQQANIARTQANGIDPYQETGTAYHQAGSLYTANQPQAGHVISITDYAIFGGIGLLLVIVMLLLFNKNKDNKVITYVPETTKENEIVTYVPKK